MRLLLGQRLLRMPVGSVTAVDLTVTVDVAADVAVVVTVAVSVAVAVISRGVSPSEPLGV
jgi:hypothetical protein